jgi:hypothetical protein
MCQFATHAPQQTASLVAGVIDAGERNVFTLFDSVSCSGYLPLTTGQTGNKPGKSKDRYLTNRLDDEAAD